MCIRDSIELAAPVSHIWYFKGTPSRIGQVLDISPKRLEEVLYFTKYIVDVYKRQITACTPVTSLKKQPEAVSTLFAFLEAGSLLTSAQNPLFL